MKKQISNTFSGILKLAPDSKEYDTFFHVVDDLVTLLPATGECEKKIDELAKSNGAAGSPDWLFGYTESGCSVAFFKPTGLDIGFSSPVYLHPAKFRSPIILQSTGPSNIDLQTFDEMEFRGGVLDWLQVPSQAIEWASSGKYIEFRNPDVYTKKFPVNVNGIDFELIYMVSLSDLVRELGKVPDLRRDIHSVLRFKFHTPQPINMFETYYQYALRFFQFCVGRSNLDYSVRLHKSVNNVPYTILTRIVVGFEDFAKDKLGCMHVIHFDDLQFKLPNLFKVINETNRQPNLSFLPKRNRDVGKIYYTNITDLCVALEQEYQYSKRSIIVKDREQAKALAKELNRLIDNSHYPNYVKVKAKSLNSGVLANMQPSLKEKIIALYDDFSVQIKAITKSTYYDNNSTPVLYNDNDFKRLIGRFVDIRNKVAHAFVEWNEGAAIYQHLQMLLYFNVLKRAGYSQDESQKILNNLFGWKFLGIETKL